MESASRSKLLHCFRPMVDMDLAIEPERSDGLGFASDLSGDEMRLVSEKKRTFSRAVKAVFFEAVLSKRVRDAKCDKQKTKVVINGEMSLIHKNRTGTTLSSSRSSSRASTTSDSAKRKVIDRRDCESKSKEDSNHRRNNMGLCFLLISFAVTVLCGRFLAIVFTSVWLYALCWGGRRREKKSSPRPPEDEKREGDDE